MMTKACTLCGEVKPATAEYFHRHRLGKFGLNARCKSCIRRAQNTGIPKGGDLDTMWSLVRATCKVHRTERERRQARERRKQWEAMQA